MVTVSSFLISLYVYLPYQLATCMRCEVVLVDKGFLTGYAGCAWLRKVGIAKAEEVVISMHAMQLSPIICIPGCFINSLVLSMHRMHENSIFHSFVHDL